MDERPNYDAPRGLAGSDNPRMSPWKILAIVAGLIAVALGAAVALGVFRQAPADETPPPAAEGGLKIELASTQGGDRIDPDRPLRCFVEGKMVGEVTVADCAKQNGVAAQNLDVGLDSAGELAAVVAVPDAELEAAIGPLGPEPLPEPEPVMQQTEFTPAAASGGPVGECMRHAGGDWRSLGDALQLDTCVQILFTGRCEAPGSAAYGRWNGQTVRLVTGRVEIAADGADFRTLVEQDASCMLP